MLGRDAPFVTKDPVTGDLTIHWPEPRPFSFEITSEVFESLINVANLRFHHRGPQGIEVDEQRLAWEDFLEENGSCLLGH